MPRDASLSSSRSNAWTPSRWFTIETGRFLATAPARNTVEHVVQAGELLPARADETSAGRPPPGRPPTCRRRHPRTRIAARRSRRRMNRRDPSCNRRAERGTFARRVRRAARESATATLAGAGEDPDTFAVDAEVRRHVPGGAAARRGGRPQARGAVDHRGDTGYREQPRPRRRAIRHGGRTPADRDSRSRSTTTGGRVPGDGCPAAGTGRTTSGAFGIDEIRHVPTHGHRSPFRPAEDDDLLRHLPDLRFSIGHGCPSRLRTRVQRSADHRSLTTTHEAARQTLPRRFELVGEDDWPC